MDDRQLNYGLVRRKRDWCPEWLWWFACNPIPYWNDTVAYEYPQLRVFLAPLTWLLSYSIEPAGDS